MQFLMIHQQIFTDVHCPTNSHYKTCYPSCEFNVPICHKAWVQGCFCNPGFIRSPSGCVHPHHRGCIDCRDKYHSLSSTLSVQDDSGQLFPCGPVTGEVYCSPSQHCRGMVCKQPHHERICQPEKPQNCTIVTGLHFTTFDGRHCDFRNSCVSLGWTLFQPNWPKHVSNLQVQFQKRWDTCKM